jgi:hypothetical protein
VPESDELGRGDRGSNLSLLDMIFVRSMAKEEILLVMPMEGSVITWWGSVIDYEKGEVLVAWDTPIGPLYEGLVR